LTIGEFNTGIWVIRDPDLEKDRTNRLLGCRLVGGPAERGAMMLDVQTSVLGTRHSFVGERSVTLGDFLQLKDAFTAALWERGSNRDVLRVLERAADENGFIAALTHRGSRAFEGYHLTAEAKAALLSGDIRWIEAHMGKLSERQQTWLWCRLGQEIW
jgi:hypothetical protein